TGVDLVEKMIRVAAGEPLGMSQDDVKLTGWAIESRLYAEDPYRNFLPSIGRLTRYRPPEEGVRTDATILRNDTGVYEGGEISMYYDPMIAKLCTWAPDRLSAIDAMAQALDDFEVDGIGHNLPFLSAVMGHERFRSGNITTAFIAEEFPDGFHGVEPDAGQLHDLAAIAVALQVVREERATQTSGTMENHKRKLGADWVVSQMTDSFAAHVAHDGATLMVALDGKAAQTLTSDWRPGQPLAKFTVDGRKLSVKVSFNGSHLRLRHRGMDLNMTVRRPRVAELAELMPVKVAKDTSRMLLCPMPGLVRAILVNVGDIVEAGQALAMVEAMKMENVLRAERKAVVKRIAAVTGASLAVDELIMEFE
ncbi:MAG: biotin/lipoyl-containing protein, partial [Rhizobiaceae bacterium]